MRSRYGEKDPRVFTLRSIISSCEIGEAMMQLLFSSVERALGDSESLLHRAVNTALKVGMKVPTRIFAGKEDPERVKAELAATILARLPAEDADSDDDDDDDVPLAAPVPATRRRAKLHG